MNVLFCFSISARLTQCEHDTETPSILCSFYSNILFYTILNLFYSDRQTLENEFPLKDSKVLLYFIVYDYI